MKNTQLIFILVILSIYITEEQETCSSNFDGKLSSKCSNLDQDCKNEDGLGCYRRGCSNAKDSTSCLSTLPSDPKNKYCIWESSDCVEKKKTCSMYDPARGDTCNLLQARSNYECVLTSETTCEEFPKICSGSDFLTCGILDGYTRLADPKLRCTWGYPNPSDHSIPENCHTEIKTCDESYGGVHFFYDGTNNICNQLKKNDDNNICIYFNGKCKEVKKTCGGYDQYSCNIFDEGGHVYDNMPADETTYFYNLKQKCVWDKNKNGGECVPIDRQCDDFNQNIDMDICKNLRPTDKDNQVCVFDSDSNKCIEKYNSCQQFSVNTPDKDRAQCEDSLSLIDTNDKCEFILGQHNCQKKEAIYPTCSDYDKTGEKDRIKCESIINPNHPYYCVLDKDTQCIERELICSEVNDPDDCLHIAKASEPNKKCAYDSSITPSCYEEYIKCEDYIGKSTDNQSTKKDNCEKIKLYNGLKCEYDIESDRCRTRKKVCSEALTKEECKLIAKTGVSDPDRKVCEFIDENNNGNFDSGDCQEIFKYCSDYNLGDKDECTKIKPYEFEGEKIDELSKCYFEEGRIQKCQKVPKECSDADNNAILCSNISNNIKNKNIKYCRYDKSSNLCKEEYKTCESYKKTNKKGDESTYPSSTYDNYLNNKNDCQKIIPNNYENYACSYELDQYELKYKCVESKECTLFDINDVRKDELCYSFESDCKYTSSECITKTDIECKDIIFYPETTEEYRINHCNEIPASKPYKKCTLKEDKSGCEEIYKDISFSTAASSYKEPPGSGNQESSEMIGGVQLIMILLCLLF